MKKLLPLLVGWYFLYSQNYSAQQEIGYFDNQQSCENIRRAYSGADATSHVSYMCYYSIR